MPTATRSLKPRKRSHLMRTIFWLLRPVIEAMIGTQKDNDFHHHY